MIITTIGDAPADVGSAWSEKSKTTYEEEEEEEEERERERERERECVRVDKEENVL